MAKGKRDEREVLGEVIQVNNVPHKRVAGDVLVPVGEQNPELFDGGSLDEGDLIAPALQGIMTELGASDDEAKVIVSKAANVNGVRKDVYLFECHPNGFTMQDLQEHYGEGDYRIKVFGKQAGTNYKVIHANKVVSIGPARNVARKSDAPVPVQQNTSGASDVARAIAETLAPVLAAQGALLAKLANNDGGSSRKAMLEEMQLMAGILGSGKSSGGGMAETLQLLATAKTIFAGNGEGGGGAEPNEYSVIMEGLKTFGAFVANAKGVVPDAAAVPALPQPKAAPVRAQPQPHAAPADSGGEIQPSPEDEEMLAVLRLQLNMMLNAAKNNGNPETWAGMIYENAPDEILTIIDGENYFAELCKIAPDFAPYKEWCDKVRALVVADLDQDPAWVAARPAKPVPLTGEPVAGKTTGNVTRTTTEPVSAPATPRAP